MPSFEESDIFRGCSNLSWWKVKANGFANETSRLGSVDRSVLATRIPEQMRKENDLAKLEYNLPTYVSAAAQKQLDLD